MTTKSLPKGQVWKRVWILEARSENRLENNIFGLKQGQDFGNQAAHVRQEFPVVSGTNTSVSETEAKASPAC